MFYTLLFHNIIHFLLPLSIFIIIIRLSVKIKIKKRIEREEHLRKPGLPPLHTEHVHSSLTK